MAVNEEFRVSGVGSNSISCKIVSMVQFNRTEWEKLLDYAVRPRQHVRRNCEAALLGCFEVDSQFEFCRCFNRQIARLRALENLVHVSGSATVANVEVRAV